MTFEYSGMPDGDDWIERIPSVFVDGEGGFELRLVRDLDAVGVRAYTVGRLTDRVTSIPPAIPVFLDWLRNLDERIPGPEGRHRSGLRSSLIRALDDTAARGNRAAIGALFEQLERTRPPLEPPQQIWASEILTKLATKDDYDQMIQLFNGDNIQDGTRVAIVRYLGRYRRTETRHIALASLDNKIVREEAIRTLGNFRDPQLRDVIGRHADDTNPRTRSAVAAALRKLPAL